MIPSPLHLKNISTLYTGKYDPLYKMSEREKENTSQGLVVKTHCSQEHKAAPKTLDSFPTNSLHPISNNVDKLVRIRSSPLFTTT